MPSSLSKIKRKEKKNKIDIKKSGKCADNE